MSPALQPEHKTGMPEETRPHETIDGTTPINVQVAHFRQTIHQLEREAEMIDAFLSNPNVTDGPLMDMPIREMASRLNVIKQALRKIADLKPGDDYEARIDSALREISAGKA